MAANKTRGILRHAVSLSMAAAKIISTCGTRTVQACTSLRMGARSLLQIMVTGFWRGLAGKNPTVEIWYASWLTFVGLVVFMAAGVINIFDAEHDNAHQHAMRNTLRILIVILPLLNGVTLFRVIRKEMSKKHRKLQNE